MKFKNILYLTLILLITGHFIGCTQEQPEPVKAELNTSFQLEIGEQALIQSEDMRILLVNVTEDSRCPSNVTCIWEGQAAVMIYISQGGHRVGNFKLIERSGYENLSVTNFDGYSIELIGVEPYPKSTQRIELSEYTAVFRVSGN